MKYKPLSLLRLVLLALATGPSLNPVVSAAQQQAQANTVAGVVSVPVSQNKQRSFRGNQYRNRLAPDRSGPARAETRSPFDDVVISAHPLDFAPLLEAAPPAVRLDQRDAKFLPRVLPIMVGAKVEFVNQDRFYHNVFSLSPKFDTGRKATGVVAEHVFEMAGTVEIFCDIHPQMSATLLVLDTKWFTRSDSTGNFRLEGLPDGRYELRAYHPEHDGITRTIELGDGGVPMTQSFVFGR